MAALPFVVVDQDQFLPAPTMVDLFRVRAYKPTFPTERANTFDVPDRTQTSKGTEILSLVLCKILPQIVLEFATITKLAFSWRELWRADPRRAQADFIP